PTPALPASFAGGRYQVQRFLGEGGRKRVYLAHDSKLDRDVAIAVIKTEGLDEAGLARVQREAQAMGRLGDHPHIVTVHDIGDEDAQPYIVSQYMAGGDLEGLLRDAENHRLPLDQALRIANEVRQALEHAHSRGIVHRDLKPGNIWLTEAPSARSGQAQTAKLGDFGLAMAVDRSRLTTQGMMLGTAAYMPPEQALGRQADARSDLYSLGCVLYEMVTGRPPFLGDDAVAIISQHINTAPVTPSWHNSAVPRALENLILALLAKDPQERPESAAAVGEELRRIQQVSAEGAAVEPATAAGVELQPGLVGRFVGRRQEIDELKAALEDTLSGKGRLMMLVGEPGIGKTRLAQEFAVYASLRGAQVLTGRCYEARSRSPISPSSRRSASTSGVETTPTCAGSWARAPPRWLSSSPRCASASPTSPRRRPWRATPNAFVCSRALPASSATPPRPTPWSSSSTTSTGRTNPRCSFSTTWP
ncbi:hypothetical protein LCGC14_2564360, partial [marine sediment metagenome]